MQEALLSLLLLQHLVVAMWRVHSRGLEREAVLALRTGWKSGAGPWGESRNATGPCYRVPLGTQSQAANGRNASAVCSALSPAGTQSPPQAGRVQTPPSPNHLPSQPSPGFGGQHGNRERRSAPRSTPGHCQQRPLSVGAGLMPAAPAGKRHCPVGIYHREPRGLLGLAQRWVKVAQLRGWPRRQFGRSRHRKNKKKQRCGWVRMQRPYLELWEETLPLRAGSFPSFSSTVVPLSI